MAPLKGPTPGKVWCMRPDLHQQVSDLLEDDLLYFTFHHSDTSRGVMKDYDSNISGRFECLHETCSSKGWRSKKIAIYIRLYANEQYNAQIYHQRCKKCNHLGSLVLDEGCYAERVAYRLKKWSGFEMEPPPYESKKGEPHESSLCEGCKNGHCKQGRRLDDDFTGQMTKLSLGH